VAPPAPSGRKLALLVAALALVAGLLYAPSLGNEFVNWDDREYTVDNAELQQPFWTGVDSMFSTFLLGNYNALQRLSYWIDWQLSGGQAWLFRAVNLLLHVINAGLVYCVLRSWLKRDLAALIGAGLFLVLPANVENVAWISERKTLLATLFGLASLALWLRERPGPALACFAVGLLAKTSIIVLPGLLVLFDYQQRRKPRWGWYLAYLLPAAVMATVQMVADSGEKAVPLHGGTLWTHAATAVSVLPSYALSAVTPFGHLPKHVYEPVTSAGDPRLWLGLVAWVAAGYGIWRSLRHRREFAVACCFALAALHLTLVVPIPIVFADRYLYLATPLLLGVAAAWVLERPIRAQKPIGVIATAWGATLMVGTFTYSAAWNNSVALWTYAIERQPEDRESWMSLAGAYGEKDDLRAVGKVLELTVRRFPDFENAKVNLAMLEVHLGHTDKAIGRLQAVLRANRQLGIAWSSLAIAYRSRGEPDAAARVFADGLRHCPSYLPLAESYVQFHLNAGRWSEARAVATSFIDANPGDRAAVAALTRAIEAAAPR